MSSGVLGASSRLTYKSFTHLFWENQALPTVLCFDEGFSLPVILFGVAGAILFGSGVALYIRWVLRRALSVVDVWLDSPGGRESMVHRMRCGPLSVLLRLVWSSCWTIASLG